MSTSYIDTRPPKGTPSKGAHTGCARPSFLRLVRCYLGSLHEYREAKGAVHVAQRLGHQSDDLEWHAAKAQTRHVEAFHALLDMAVQLKGQGETGTALQGERV